MTCEVDAAEQARWRLNLGVRAVRSVRMRWIGHRLHAQELDVDHQSGRPTASLTRRTRTTHAIPKLTTALIHAYPADHTSRAARIA
jgi:hypothetical protein